MRGFTVICNVSLCIARIYIHTRQNITNFSLIFGKQVINSGRKYLSNFDVFGPFINVLVIMYHISKF